MAGFASPRFAGDPLPEEILADPDTGDVKLGPGSPAASVVTLQRALFDLTWNLRIKPPVHEAEAFVDGEYGPRTTEAVTAFKRHYGIHFPPSAPTGSVDGFAGPRTFAALDPKCVLVDEALEAIRAKVDELNANGVPCELTAFVHPTHPLLGTSGTFSAAHVAGTSGAVFYKRGIGAHEVHGPIFDAYSSGGFASGPFGFPVEDERPAEDPFLRVSVFEHGFITLAPDTGEVRSIGPEAPGPPEAPVF